MLTPSKVKAVGPVRLSLIPLVTSNDPRLTPSFALSLVTYRLPEFATQIFSPSKTSLDGRNPTGYLAPLWFTSYQRLRAICRGFKPIPGGPCGPAGPAAPCAP